MSRTARSNSDGRVAAGLAGRTSSVLSGWIAAAMFGFAVMSGMAIAVLGPAASILTPAVGVALLTLCVASYFRADLVVVGFGGLLALFIVLPLLYKVTGINWVNNWQFMAFAFALFGTHGFVQECRSDGTLRAALACFALFVLLGIVSAIVADRSHLRAAAYQLFSNFKPILLLLLGFAVYRQGRGERVLWFVVSWLWVPLASLVVLQWIGLSIYVRLFPYSGNPAAGIAEFLPSLAYGVFEHPGMLASCAGTMALLSALRSFNLPSSQLFWTTLSIVYFMLLVASGGRGELAATLLAFGVLLLLWRPDRLLVSSLLAFPLVAITGLAYWYAYGDSLVAEAAKWGGAQYAAIEQPRAQLYEAAIFLANQYFPLGSGLGTFGGAGSTKFDLSLYFSLGFGRYWWFPREDYLLDVYWHNALGEGGWFALVAQILQYVLLVAYAVKGYLGAIGMERIYWGGAALGTLQVLANSMASPAFQDPRLFIWAALCFGLAGAHRRCAGVGR